jgi:hypothetical protein
MSAQTNPPRPPAAGARHGEASDATGKAQEKAQEAAGQAQEKAQAAAGQAQVKLREQLDQRSAQVAEQIDGQASDLRSVSGALREQGKQGPAKAADRLAQYAEKVGDYLRDKDSDALLRDAEDFGRRQPAAVAAGGVALGFLASRFLKASSRQRYASRSTGQPAPHRPPGSPRGAGRDRGVAGATASLPGTTPASSGVPVRSRV